jgi:hypothetical protein
MNIEYIAAMVTIFAIWSVLMCRAGWHGRRSNDEEMKAEIERLKSKLSGPAEFNINSYVAVKLTSAGLDTLVSQRDELQALYPRVDLGNPLPFVDEEGYSKFQLWALMHDLGHQCILGQATPFDTTIKLTPTYGVPLGESHA